MLVPGFLTAFAEYMNLDMQVWVIDQSGAHWWSLAGTISIFPQTISTEGNQAVVYCGAQGEP